MQQCYRSAQVQLCPHNHSPWAQGDPLLRHRAVGFPRHGASSSFWSVARPPTYPMAVYWLVQHAGWSLTRIYPLRQIETVAGLKPAAHTCRGPSSPARLLRGLAMHIHGDQYRVACPHPMARKQKDRSLGVDGTKCLQHVVA